MSPRKSTFLIRLEQRASDAQWTKSLSLIAPAPNEMTLRNSA